MNEYFYLMILKRIEIIIAAWAVIEYQKDSRLYSFSSSQALQHWRNWSNHASILIYTLVKLYLLNLCYVLTLVFVFCTERGCICNMLDCLIYIQEVLLILPDFFKKYIFSEFGFFDGVLNTYWEYPRVSVPL